MKKVFKRFGNTAIKASKCAFLLLLSLGVFSSVNAQKKQKPTPPLQQSQNGNLVYTPDSLGNRIPDFSYAGYKASSDVIPFVPVKVVVEPVDGDMTATLQNALDYVSTLPVDQAGFRGAILLKAGHYQLDGRLTINQSGVVLRGSGFGENGTVLIAAGKSRETLIRVEGKPVELNEAQANITQAYVHVGAFQFQVENAAQFQPGDQIAITRPSTQEWIDQLDMNEFGGETAWLGWKAGERDLRWDRTVVAVKADSLVLDAPLTTALDKAIGGAYVQKYQEDGRIQNIGIENLNIRSEFNSENKKDEEHCWNGISFENTTNAWVRQIQFKHLAGSAVAVYETASKVTVEDCLSFEPVSEIGALRRYTFFTSGQQCLFLRLYAEFGYHDFGTGVCTAGPNAFVQCESHLPASFSGAIDSWASGVLFDIVNVDGNALSFRNREMNDYGSGWTAANSMFWQCSAARIECYSPPGANNWAYGAWAQFAGNGYWNNANEHINPRSLFYAQLAERIGADNTPKAPVIDYTTDATSSPTVEVAAELTEYAENPAITLIEFIEQKVKENPISLEAGDAKLFSQIKFKKETEQVEEAAPSMELVNGWLVRGSAVLTGQRHAVPWWSGSMRPRKLKQAQPAVTRYVPGRQGLGYTDRLTDVIQWMKDENKIGLEQHYALWYDRRRDDHERIRRMDGEAWAPYYELPFARTGKELAWDGLSKYDLTKYNPWYWGRLKQFADLADQNGLVLIHQDYFQHNIIEAGAHWVDSPWRTVNNLNNTGFPEPVPFAGDKRVFMDKHFYDVTNPVRRELHRQYIRQCMENFKDNNGVIQLTSAEFTGPLHFMQFWLDVIAGWEQETGRDVMVGLSATKDVQDSILADPVRSKIVDLIDIRYWSSRDDGTQFAPLGGQHLAPRQHMRLEKIGKRSFDQVYNDVLTYKKAFPAKAVMYSFDQSDKLAWAIFMAGGSLAGIPPVKVDGFLNAASAMQAEATTKEGVYKLGAANGSGIFYLDNRSPEYAAEVAAGSYQLIEIDPATGEQIGKAVRVKGGKQIQLQTGGKSEAVFWLRK
ncbi:DUF6298 domain-containing protein [Mangrovibacterium diazotrophicum]|uniref:DUF6298 domain-containing protein n=1 Tax=Mangrovibacterium diazotrophicum TaxID=1261403 RepID=A0A419W4A1_9BACT|nr:DUF6298 domain-containing protein [Mangrovibacterium diazotrophicum]RKD90275.1 hypothetical protein BC643_0611 [Mangrovibacterium diazotrophicum]